MSDNYNVEDHHSSWFIRYSRFGVRKRRYHEGLHMWRVLRLREMLPETGLRVWKIQNGAGLVRAIPWSVFLHVPRRSYPADKRIDPGIKNLKRFNGSLRFISTKNYSYRSKVYYKQSRRILLFLYRIYSNRLRCCFLVFQLLKFMVVSYLQFVLSICWFKYFFYLHYLFILLYY